MKKKEIEEKLKAKELEYSSLFEEASDGIFISDDKGNYLDVNPSACKMLGYLKEEILKLNVHEILIPGETTIDPPRFDKLLAGKTILTVRNLIKRDGSIIPVEITSKMLSNGKFLGMVRDITERKESERKINSVNEDLEQKVKKRTIELEAKIRLLKESEEKFYKVFQTSAAGITISKISDSTYVEVNHAFIELTGYSEDELINHSSIELGIVSDFKRREEVLQQVRDQGYSRAFELTIRHKSGRALDVLSSIETIILNDEKYAINIIYDVTERKKMEERLRKNNEFFFNLFEYNPASIVISHLNDGRIVNVNESFLSLFGFSNKEEVVGKTASELKIVGQPQEREKLPQSLQSSRVMKDFEVQVYTKQGKVLWVSTSILIIDIEDKPCIFSISMDISKQKKIEEQLLEINKELESFSYSVSHDLRAPIRSIIGYSKMLEEDCIEKLSEDENRLLGVINNNAVKMNDLIDSLLEFSKLGKKEVNKTEISTENIVKNILDDLGHTSLLKSNIKVSCLFDTKADSALITQVWINLISNSIKYSAKKDNPTIEIGSYKERNDIVFYIKDNGEGFDMNYAGKLFGVFQRLHSASEFEGTGVGLALVHRIITKHEGRVWAEGKIGEGATFYFSLPYF